MSLFGFLRKNRSCQLLADPGDVLSRKYGHFRALLGHNDAVLDALAALEQAFYGGEMLSAGAARQACLRMAEAVEAMARELESLSHGRHEGLRPALARLMPRVLEALAAPAPPVDGPAVLDLSRVTPADAPRVGGKASNLARVGWALGLPVPDGFVLTTQGFQRFLNDSGLAEYAAGELEPVSPLDLADLEARCARIRARIAGTPFPPDLVEALAQAVDGLRARSGLDVPLAVRSSAVGEDGAASFAGQYESVLDVTPEGLEAACKAVLASKYTPRAVLYRLRHGLDDADAPMAALILNMVPARASGVLYTRDPASTDEANLRVDAVEGLGDRLVSGQAQPGVGIVSRAPLAVRSLSRGFPLDRDSLLRLAAMGLALEEHFGAPQDVEWCQDAGGALVIVQSRPLDQPPAEAAPVPVDSLPEGSVTLLNGGVCASPGAASGPVVHVSGGAADIPEGAILAAVNASPDLAALLDQAGGIVTRMGGAASHLASVAREMGVPALFGLPGCPEGLEPGSVVTLDATGGRVLAGRVEPLLGAGAPMRSSLVDSPMHRRLRAALDLVSPLTLTDPGAENFTPQGCATLHDMVRYSHEAAMREMFSLGDGAQEDGVRVLRLKAAIPLTLYCVDLGGGLRENLTTCDSLTPADLRSEPMLAIWRGFTHPGITWSGTVAFDPKSFLTLLASSATADLGGDTPGGDSYALVGREYMNLSARFGYHFSNVDAFCGDQPGQNHISLRFAGGAGGYAGKCLRVAFLSRVLERLGYSVSASGDVLDATFKGAPARETLDALEQLGRLLASSRLLDMAIRAQAEVDAMAEAFLRGDYDLLAKRQQSPLPRFHLTNGDWERLEEEGEALARVDGARWATGLSRGVAGLMGKVAGVRYQRFLDSIEAYFHFPLAVAKDSRLDNGEAEVLARPVSGTIDRAGGLAFGVQSAGTYYVLRLNALEDNVILFEFTDGRRRELASAAARIGSGQWRRLGVKLEGDTVTGYLDGAPCIVQKLERSPAGLVGLWSKADSVTDFKGLRLRDAAGEREFPA